ncbi:hypothetical protein P4639_22390 [Priestia megaterium]|uniref:hypothetical protein n=1 Tax=Priestia megaterium TaxID=1404 RepID=UPI002E1FBFFF|nr:hypothetical protein [Priestia megaterium]
MRKTRVELTKKQIDAIEHAMLNHSLYKDNPAKLVEDHAKIKGQCSSHNSLGALSSMNLDTLIRALYVGYTLKKSSVDLVRDYFNDLDADYTADNAKRHAVIATLDILGIKIKGVNEHE